MNLCQVYLLEELKILEDRVDKHIWRSPAHTPKISLSQEGQGEKDSRPSDNQQFPISNSQHSLDSHTEPVWTLVQVRAWT